MFLPDIHAQHVTARMLNHDDVCLAISHTGSTIETLSTVRSAGASTVALTSVARLPLTELVDQLLVAGSRETSYRIEAMTSRIVHLAVLDPLFVLMALRHEGTAQAQAGTPDVLIEHQI
jgi:DNA-binding MurR/RpiR family transcriptional regulator